MNNGLDKRNIVITVVLTAVILLSSQFLLPHQKPPAQPPAQKAQSTVNAPTAPKPESAAQAANTPTDVAAPGLDTAAAKQTRQAALASSPRVPVDTPRLKGSIALKGATFDDLALSDYHETVDPKSPAIILLSPAGAPDAYFARQGWIAKAGGIKLPDQNTLWTVPAGAKLTPSTPVTLTWDNGAGLKFERTISVDNNYVFTVTDKVTNTGSAAVTLSPYALISRSGPIPQSSTYISYEGPMGGFDNGAHEVKYSSIEPTKPVEYNSTGGWVGFTDKYWLTAVAPKDQAQPLSARFSNAKANDADKYQVDWLGADKQIVPGATASSASYVFAGAKVVRLLNAYTDNLHLPHFDVAVDWGWFWFLTKPIFFVLDYINGLVGNFGVAILILTVIVKIIFFPLANKSYVNIHRMKQLQPEMAKIREKWGDDKVRIQQETMALYKRVGANPVFGCLPVLVQIPVFFSLYKVLYVTIEMRHAPFFGWIHDLSAPDPTSILTLFGLVHWAPPQFLDFLNIGIWPLIYCATMFLQQSMQPPMPDPMQAKMMKWLPVVFTFMLGRFAAGLVIYWSWNNILTVTQQYFITRRLDHVKQRVPA